jgi:hypothetical protein
VPGGLSKKALLLLLLLLCLCKQLLNTTQGDGVVGILTRGVIDRAHYYSHALVLALIPFQHGSEMYG